MIKQLPSKFTKFNLADVKEKLGTYWQLTQNVLRIFLKRDNQASQLLLSVELSAQYIKILNLSKSQQHVQVDYFAMASMPPGAVQKGEITQSTVIAHALRQLITQKPTSLTNISLSIPRAAAIIKSMTVSNQLSDDETESRIWIEANKLFPDLINNIYLDYSILGPSQKEAGQLDVLLVACRKDYIKPYFDVIESADLKLKVIDVNSYALERAVLETIDKEFLQKTFAILNINFNQMTLIVILNGKQEYAHEQVYDGSSLITFIQGENQGEEAIRDERSQAILKSSLSLHLRHLMQFFYSTRPNLRIEKFLLSGDVALIPGIHLFVGEEVNAEVTIYSPFKNIIVNPSVDAEALNKVAPSLLLCAGLALSQLK